MNSSFLSNETALFPLRRIKMINPFYRLKFKLLTFLTFLSIAFFGGFAQAADDSCKQAKKGLNGDYEVLQTKGGIWGYMEQTSALKEKSTMGLSADSKLQRALVIFDSLCDSDKKPSHETYSKIQKPLMNASSILNNVPGRTPVADILVSIEALNKELDELLKTLESK